MKRIPATPSEGYVPRDSTAMGKGMPAGKSVDSINARVCIFFGDQTSSLVPLGAILPDDQQGSAHTRTHGSARDPLGVKQSCWEGTFSGVRVTGRRRVASCRGEAKAPTMARSTRPLCPLDSAQEGCGGQAKCDRSGFIAFHKSELRKPKVHCHIGLRAALLPDVPSLTVARCA